MRRLLAVCCLAAAVAHADVVDIDTAELARLNAAGVPVIDVRTAAEWEATGVVPGSRLITFFDGSGQADPAAWLEKARAVARPGEAVAIICRSGHRSKTASDFLSRQPGYGKVYNVRGGIVAWAREGRPLASPAPALAACRAAKTC